MPMTTAEFREPFRPHGLAWLPNYPWVVFCKRYQLTTSDGANRETGALLSPTSNRSGINNSQLMLVDNRLSQPVLIPESCEPTTHRPILTALGFLAPSWSLLGLENCPVAEGIGGGVKIGRILTAWHIVGLTKGLQLSA
jgi:hypothetical protein